MWEAINLLKLVSHRSPTTEYFTWEVSICVQTEASSSAQWLIKSLARIFPKWMFACIQCSTGANALRKSPFMDSLMAAQSNGEERSACAPVWTAGRLWASYSASHWRRAVSTRAVILLFSSGLQIYACVLTPSSHSLLKIMFLLSVFVLFSSV